MDRIIVAAFLHFASVYYVLAPGNLPELHLPNSSVATYVGGEQCNFIPSTPGAKFAANDNVNMAQTEWESTGMENSAKFVEEILKRITGHDVPTVNVSVSIPPPKDLMSWDQFKKEHKDRVYSSPAEETLRKEIFEQNLRVIHEKNYLNSINLQSSKLGITSMADLTKEEYEKRSTGSLPFDRPADEHFSNKTSRKIPDVKLKDQLNWALEGYVGKVRDQGVCSSCWAHTVAAMAEALQMRATGNFLRLSPQYLIECYDSKNYGETFTRDNCKGGNAVAAFHFVIDYGIALDSSYPYTSSTFLLGKAGKCDPKKRKCVTKFILPKSLQKRPLAQVLPAGDELALKHAVFKYGPIMVRVHASLWSFASYMGGVYADVNCKLDPTHAMLLIGYGTDEVDGDFWLLLGSNGTKWAIKGIMKLAAMWENKPEHMKKGVEKINNGNMCGIASHAYHQTIFQDWETF